MILKVFSVYDSKVQAYMQPWFVRTTGEACRGFEEAVNNSETQFNKHPGDFTLFEIGWYNDETGRLECLEAYVNLGTALQVKRDLSSAPVADIRKAN